MKELTPIPRGPHGWLELTVQPPMRGWNAHEPTVLVDGGIVAAGFGTTRIPLTPGVHHVKVTPAWKLIHVECDVAITDGEVSQLWYALPLARPHAGSIGPAPQPNHAQRYLLLIAAFIVIGLIVTLLR